MADFDDILLSSNESTYLSNATYAAIYNHSILPVGPLGPTTQTAAATYLTLIVSCGLILNLLVIMAFFRNKPLHKPCNLLLVNTAISDFCVSLTTYSLSTVAAYLNRWPYGFVVCQVNATGGYLFAIVNMLSLMLISVERYMLVCQPCKVKHVFSMKRTRLYIGCVWVTALIFSIMPLVGWGEYTIEMYQYSCTIDWANPDAGNFSYIMVSFLLIFFIPLLIMIWSYCNIVQVMRRQRLRFRQSSAQQDRKRMKTEMRITVMAAIFIASYMICWTPYAILSFLSASSYFTYVRPEISLFAPLCAKSTVLLDPLIYCASHDKFRAAILVQIGCGKRVDVRIMKFLRRINFVKTASDGSASQTGMSQENATFHKSSFGRTIGQSLSLTFMEAKNCTPFLKPPGPVQSTFDGLQVNGERQCSEM